MTAEAPGGGKILQPKPMSVKEKIISFGRPLTAPELASALGVTDQQVYRYARKGEIPCFRIGGAVRFEPEAICEWFDKQ